MTGRVGVCDATVGPGATKLPSGLAEALNSSVPILAYRKALEEEQREEEDFGGLPRTQRTRGEGEEGGSWHDEG